MLSRRKGSRETDGYGGERWLEHRARQADRQTGRHTDNGGYWLTHMGHTRSYSDARNDK